MTLQTSLFIPLKTARNPETRMFVSKRTVIATVISHAASHPQMLRAQLRRGGPNPNRARRTPGARPAQLCLAKPQSFFAADLRLLRQREQSRPPPRGRQLPDE